VIQVDKKPEPASFNGKVRIPGVAFLRTAIRPIPSDKFEPHWRKAIPDLRKAYGNFCAYTGVRIEPVEVATVDHFISRKSNPDLAYEWDNFRLCRGRINSRKNEFEDVLDPFEIENGWFILDFDTLDIHANAELDRGLRQKIQQTITRLGLNQELPTPFKEERYDWLSAYCDGDCTFRLLQKRTPFIAHELERQGLVERIKEMWEGRIR
jgi:hypothetical protein